MRPCIYSNNFYTEHMLPYRGPEKATNNGSNKNTGGEHCEGIHWPITAYKIFYCHRNQNKKSKQYNTIDNACLYSRRE